MNPACFDDNSMQVASAAPRLALHAAELGFIHPVTDETMHWSMPLPTDLQAFLNKMRNKK